MLDLPIFELAYEFLVSTPMGGKVLTSTVYLDYLIIFDHYTSIVDLICMPMTGIDVILGMNQLSTNHVLLECHNKTVRFPLNWLTPTVLIEITNLLVYQVENCVQYSVETTSTTCIEEILVVRDFPEVFPLKIKNLPLEREVNFSIDLLPGTEPIFITPYRMSLLELRQLKEQLEYLLAKNFIRPNDSP